MPKTNQKDLIIDVEKTIYNKTGTQQKQKWNQLNMS
jgi:hypothetical protein